MHGNGIGASSCPVISILVSSIALLTNMADELPLPLAREAAAAAAPEPELPPPKTTCNTPRQSNGLLSSSSVAGIKRPATTSLLPAFEPSSPMLPRALNPFKRQNTGNNSDDGRHGQTRRQLPTPVPTSSTGIMSSSPPQRPGLARSQSERAPLGAVATVELRENGEVLMMGRSSNSSHYQLSANRLVSRVHVKARYIPAANPLEPNKIEIICNGWNGLKLHSQGKTWELFKEDSFTSETEGSDIMIDVQDARVMVQWPKRTSDALAGLSDSSWDDSPRRTQTRGSVSLQSSPLRRQTRIQSPESPTPAHSSASQRLQALFPSPGDDEPSIQIYEDAEELELPEVRPLDVNASMRTEATASFSSDLSELEDDDPDEENDPVVHSFGPFGANISGRFASITTQSPRAGKSPRARALKRKTSKENVTPESLSAVMEDPDVVSGKEEDEEEHEPALLEVKLDPSIANHVINQLAWSRLSSTPLSTIMQNLPTEAKQDLSKEVLKVAIEAAPAIGIIARQGKDAAGKPLESEYYYVPEKDDDEPRRTAVVDGLRKPSLRNCRKQHKVCSLLLIFFCSLHLANPSLAILLEAT